MSIAYENTLTIIGGPQEIDRVLPELIERGWSVTDRDRLAIKLEHLGEALSIPDSLALNHELIVALSSRDTSYNTLRLETSDAGFVGSTLHRGLQFSLSPWFGSHEPEDIEELTIDAGREIARYDRAVSLPRITSLTAAQAAAIAPHAAALRLPNLRSIDTETARELAKHVGPLHLDGLESLSMDVAREFAASTATLSFAGVKHVTPEAIAVLARGVPHPKYHRSGWTSRFTGNLELDGLESLTPELARAIATHPRNIQLNGLKTLSADSARELARSRQGFIVLRGLEVLSDEAAECLGNTTAGLILPGLKTLTARAAAALARTAGGLFLNGLEKLDVAVGAALAWHEGHLGLWGVKKADCEALEAIEQHRGPVVLGIDGGVTICDGRPALSLNDSVRQSATPPSQNQAARHSQEVEVAANATERWFYDFLRGTKSLINYDWLREHIRQTLLGKGMDCATASEIAARLEVDIVQMLQARSSAEAGLDQLAQLNRKDAEKRATP